VALRPVCAGSFLSIGLYFTINAINVAWLAHPIDL